MATHFHDPYVICASPYAAYGPCPAGRFGVGAEGIEAGPQATLEDRFVPSGEIVLLAGKAPVIHHRAPHAFADQEASAKGAPSERSALRSRSPRRIIITPKIAA